MWAHYYEPDCVGYVKAKCHELDLLQVKACSVGKGQANLIELDLLGLQTVLCGIHVMSLS